MRAKWVLAGVALIVIVAAAIAWGGRGTYQTARLGTVYVAKQTCSCLFVARRTLESCRTDYEADAIAPLKLEVGASDVKVSALGGLLSAQAQFEEGFGCHPAK
jgi:hypothetical protein